MSSSKYCDLCKIQYKTLCGLRRHQRNKHGVVQQKCSGIKCCECGAYLHTSEFKTHMLAEHNVTIQTEKLTFSDESEFKNWKQALEESEETLFIKKRASKVTKNKVTITYYCHRSGKYRSNISSEAKRKRSIKIQGSKKINKFCPAKIKVTCSSPRGSLDVEYCKTHLGHGKELAHLNIAREERKKLASKIAQKIPFEAIVQEVQASVGDKILRKHLLTKQDLKNIVREYKLESEGCCDAIGLSPSPQGSSGTNEIDFSNDETSSSLEIVTNPLPLKNSNLEALKDEGTTSSSLETVNNHLPLKNSNLEALKNKVTTSANLETVTNPLPLKNNNLEASKNKVTTSSTLETVTNPLPLKNNNLEASKTKVTTSSGLETVTNPLPLKNNNLEALKNEVRQDFFNILNDTTSVKQLELIKKTLKSLSPQLNSLKEDASCFDSSGVKKVNIRITKHQEILKEKINTNRTRPRPYLKPSSEETHKIKIDSQIKSMNN